MKKIIKDACADYDKQIVQTLSGLLSMGSHFLDIIILDEDLSTVKLRRIDNE